MSCRARENHLQLGKATWSVAATIPLGLKLCHLVIYLPFFSSEFPLEHLRFWTEIPAKSGMRPYELHYLTSKIGISLNF